MPFPQLDIFRTGAGDPLLLHNK